MRSGFQVLSLALLFAPLLWFFGKISDAEAKYMLTGVSFVGVVSYLASDYLIPYLQVFLARRGLKGKDLGRKGTPDEDLDVPSALGVVVAVVFITAVIIVQLFDATTPQELMKYNAALMSICFMVLLGFADDVLDLPWRFKLALPPIASLPLLCSYTGSTSIVMPLFARSYLFNNGELTWLAKLLNIFVTVDSKADGKIINLGIYYYLFMSMLAVFSTNAINIYAGINGLEVGQAIIIAVAILGTNLFELSRSTNPMQHPHMLSAIILIVFIGASLALLKHNWYPARVFVGDTYCYFAGMTLAVVGILGHFSKTLLLFLIPQIFNFVYSLPQLFRIYPCPRHRLPAFDAKDGLRRPSRFVHNGKEYDNLTLINLVLRIVGPVREETLTFILLALQVVCCIGGIALRYYYGPVYWYAE